MAPNIKFSIATIVLLSLGIVAGSGLNGSLAASPAYMQWVHRTVEEAGRLRSFPADKICLDPLLCKENTLIPDSICSFFLKDNIDTQCFYCDNLCSLINKDMQASKIMLGRNVDMKNVDPKSGLTLHTTLSNGIKIWIFK
ncbi:hypothetical protein M8J76_007955 [Diaphorina citri]|nr:hypothetical protein M8J76_007955 [Diaphorina citri]